MPHNSPHVSVPVAEIPVPAVTDFKPALVPEQARPQVLAPLTLVRRFISSVYWVAMFVILVVGGVLSSVPRQISAFGMLVQGILTVVFIAVFISILFSLNVERVDRYYQLQRLVDLCNGDASAATPLAIDVASNATTATLGAALEMMDRENKAAARAAPAGATSGAAGAHSEAGAATAGSANDNAAPTTEAVAGASSEETRLLPNPAQEFGSVTANASEFRAAAAEGTIGAVQAEMEINSMYIMERTVKLVLKSALNVVVLVPLVCFFAGYILCKLNVKISGVELILLGFVLGVAAPLLWYIVQSRALKELDAAGKVVTMIHDAAIEQQKAKELEEQQRREREAELQWEKEKELEKVKAEKVDTAKGEKEQPNFFGIPLPKFEFNPFQKKGNDAQNDEKV